MVDSDDIKATPPPRKPLWPWLLLLVLTLAAIYSWNRATELFDDVSRNMPAVIIDLFNDILRDHGWDRPSGPGLDVVIPTRLYNQ
jgi:hypothetical protein